MSKKTPLTKYLMCVGGMFGVTKLIKVFPVNVFQHLLILAIQAGNYLGQFLQHCFEHNRNLAHSLEHIQGDIFKHFRSVLFYF